MRRVLVTGAGGGLGQAICRALAAPNTLMALQYRQNRAAVESVAAELQRTGAETTILQAELSTVDGVLSLCQAVEEEMGGVDILVNNAGDWVEKPLLETTDEEWDRLIDTDLRAAYLTIRGLARGMVARGWGRVINMSSVASLGYVSNEGLYGVAKAGINALTKAYGVELAAHGVTVNAIAPAWTLPHDAEMPTSAAHPESAQVPNGRPGHATEVAALVQFLASDAAAHITAQIIPIDGGISSLLIKGR